MDERGAIDLLKYYRHQYANDLQLVLSYAQLGRIDVVREKATEIIEIMRRDQLFHNLPLPKTIITVMRLNHATSGLEWTPIIDVDEKLDVDDHELAQIIETVHQLIIDQSMNLSLYHGTMTFQQIKSQPFKLLLACQGDFKNIDQLKAGVSKIKQLHIERATTEEIIFHWTAQN